VTVSQSNKHWLGYVKVTDPSSLDYEKFVSVSKSGAALTNLFMIPAAAWVSLVDSLIPRPNQPVYDSGCCMGKYGGLIDSKT
jgi:hypothetical protein